MTFLLLGIATTWLALSLAVALLFTRVITLNEGHDAGERQERPLPQLQLLSRPRRERERAA